MPSRNTALRRPVDLRLHEIDEDEFNGLGVMLEEEYNAQNNDGGCLVGSKICSTAGVYECQADGSMLPVDGCGSGMVCSDEKLGHEAIDRFPIG